MSRDSRWSVHTIYRTLGEIRKVAEGTYPEGRLQNAFGSWKEEASASDPADLFRVYCEKRNCLEPLLRGFGAVQNTTPISKNKVRVETTRGQSFELAENEGAFGISLYEGKLQLAKIRLLDRLDQVRKNARDFQNQKLATAPVDGGAPDPQKGDPQ